MPKIVYFYHFLTKSVFIASRKLSHYPAAGASGAPIYPLPPVEFSTSNFCVILFLMAQKRVHATTKDPRKLRPSLRASLRKRVIATYDTCAICGREVDKTLPYLDPLAPEVDEIIPVSRGGSPYDWDNLQLVHRVCNQRKGNKMEGDIDIARVENPTPVSRAW